MTGAASVYPNWAKMVLLINKKLRDHGRPAHRTGKRKFYVEEISHQQFQRAPTPINHIADELFVVEILQAVEQHSELLPINTEK